MHGERMVHFEKKTCKDTMMMMMMIRLMIMIMIMMINVKMIMMTLIPEN